MQIKYNVIPKKEPQKGLVFKHCWNCKKIICEAEKEVKSIVVIDCRHCKKENRVK